MPRTFITGATGFVGSNLVAYLRAQGWEVRCLVRDAARASDLKELGAELVLGQLSDPESIRRGVAETDAVFHVAGRVRALNSRQFAQDNVEGTRNVVEACAAQPRPPVAVLVSSIAAGGPSEPGQPRRESDVDQPVSAYGHSKLEAEKAAAKWAGQMPISIVRPPIIFGPADRASLAIFRGVQLIRLHPIPGFRSFPVSVVHVADLCDALVRIAERGTRLTASPDQSQENSAGIYYVAAERTLKYRELGDLAGQALGSGAIALPLPKTLFWLAGGTVELFSQIVRRPGLLNLDKVREAVAPAWECSDEKIRRELDYLPAEPLEQRFAATAAWYREHGWL